MKKLLILIPIILGLIGCAESELMVPGENVGVGEEVEETEPTDVILKTYDYNGNFGSYKLEFTVAGRLQQIDNTSQTNTSVSNSFVYTNDILTQYNANYGGIPEEINISYDEEGKIIALYATNLSNNLAITYNGNDISAVKSVSGFEDVNINFTIDSYGYINGFTYNDTTTNTIYEYTLNMSENLVNSIEISTEDTILKKIEFEYDNKINPIYDQSIDLFNFLMFEKAFMFDSNMDYNILENIALVRSAKNITSQSASGSLPTITTETEISTYEYSEDGYPISALLTVEESDSGSIAFTYY